MGYQCLQAFRHAQNLGYPHDVHERFHKWLPKFPVNNVIYVEDHVDTFYACFQNHLINNDDEDVIMKLFSSYLVENARKWYNKLLDMSIKTCKYFHNTFMKRWEKKRIVGLLCCLYV
jgi:hypothetical protein